MFQDYSQTYASQIAALAGLLASGLAAFNVTFLGTNEIQFIVGVAVNVAGIIWALVQRTRKGDVDALGRRIKV